jgi:hypothetical protein
MKRSIVLLGAGLLVCLGPAAQAELYLCEKDGKKLYSDRPCGNEARRIGEKAYYGPVDVREVPDDDTMQKLCQLARRGKAKERELIAQSAAGELDQREYNQGILRNSEEIAEQLRISESFRCRYRSMSNKIENIVTSGHPFGYFGELPEDGMQKCVDELRKAIDQYRDEPSRC